VSSSDRLKKKRKMGGSETGLDPKVNANLNSFVQNEDEDQNNSIPPNPHPSPGRTPRSQLQIQIGPTTGSGSVSSSRRRNQNTNTSSASSVQQMSADLIAAQLERKDKLMRALNSERSVMAKLGAEISLLRTKLQPLPNLERLKNENQRLRIECGVMATEVDLYDNGAVPLGWTLEEFYQGINPGQDANALLFSSSGRRPTGTRIGPPPRPPPPRFLSIPPQPAVDSRTGEWYCTMCTFQNHPELSKCEQCDMVRVITPSSPARPR